VPGARPVTVQGTVDIEPGDGVKNYTNAGNRDS